MAMASTFWRPWEPIIESVLSDESPDHQPSSPLDGSSFNVFLDTLNSPSSSSPEVDPQSHLLEWWRFLVEHQMQQADCSSPSATSALKSLASLHLPHGEGQSTLACQQAAGLYGDSPTPLQAVNLHYMHLLQSLFTDLEGVSSASSRRPHPQSSIINPLTFFTPKTEQVQIDPPPSPQIEQKMFSCSLCPTTFHHYSHKMFHMRYIHPAPWNPRNQPPKAVPMRREVQQCAQETSRVSLAEQWSEARFSPHTAVQPQRRKEMVHRCEACKKIFLKEKYLKEYVRDIHSGIKYPCSMCSRVFARIAGLRDHVMKMHGVLMLKKKSSFK